MVVANMSDHVGPGCGLETVTEITLVTIEPSDAGVVVVSRKTFVDGCPALKAVHLAFFNQMVAEEVHGVFDDVLGLLSLLFGFDRLLMHV